MQRRDALSSVRRVVIKIGTNVLFRETNRMDSSVMEHLVEQVSLLIRKRKMETVIVTSGAIAAGMHVLGWEKRPTHVNKLQAAASVGQSRLMRAYERLFREEGLNVGQVLLTYDIFLSPVRRENARQTLLTLLSCDVVPVINENDTVATDELKFGDNDKLSAFVTELLDAQALVMLSDVDGLHTRDPKHHAETDIIPVVTSVRGEAAAIAKRGTPSSRGRGGIGSKIEAAKYLTERGRICVIANGKKSWTLTKLFDGEEVGTVFLPT